MNPQFIGTIWTLETRTMPDGTIAGYATRFTGPTVAYNDPNYPSFSGLHVPQYVQRQLKHMMKGQEMNFPSIADVTAELWAHVQDLRGWGICNGEDEEDYCDVRLQVYPDGAWALRTGDSSYDLDHKGYWGCSSVCATTLKRECREIARELIEQAREDRAMCQ